MSESKTVKKKKKWGKIYQYTPIKRDIVLTDEKANEIETDLKKATAVTPQSLASKHGIRVSLAKKILKEYNEKGKLKLVHSKSKYQVYNK